MAKGWKHVKEGLAHYWHGTKLLAADTRTAVSLVLKTTSGNTLTRRERKQLERTVSDLFRLVPFAMFVIIPFAELFVAARTAGYSLISCRRRFNRKNKRDEQLKRELKARLNYAEFLQSTLASMAKQQAGKGGKKSRAAESLLDVIKQVQRGERVNNDDFTATDGTVRRSDYTGQSETVLSWSRCVCIWVFRRSAVITMLRWQLATQDQPRSP